MKNVVRIVYYGYGESNTYIALYEFLKEKYDDLAFQDAYHFSCCQGNFEFLSGKDLDEIEKILLRGQADMAFIPFANSDSGIVPQIRNFLCSSTYEVVETQTSKIVLYAYIHKSHQGMKGTEVETIYGNVPTFNQCSSFVAHQVPFAVYKRLASTTESMNYLEKHPEEKAICFGNVEGQKRENLILFENNAISNHGYTYTKFFLVKRRKKLPILSLKKWTKKATLKNIKNALTGYYLYESTPSEHSEKSKSPASFRIVSILPQGNELTIQGFTIGYKTNKICHSVSSTVDLKENELYFYYEYEPENQDGSKVKVIVLLKCNLSLFEKERRLKGYYYGYDNNKTGTMEFIKITKEEFEVYQREPK